MHVQTDIKKWRREIRRGVLKMCVLLLLSRREMYGYEISKALETFGGDVLHVDEGTLYPLLRRLENDEYVTAEWRFSDGKARRYYRITQKGSLFLDAIKNFWRRLIDAVDRIMEGEKHA